MPRVITYIDGFNLYFGLKSQGWERFLWLNVQALSRNLLKPDQTLARTKYFTSRVALPPDKAKRQSTYIDAISTLADTSIYFGKYQTNPHTCRSCGHVHNANSEKMTDVNIAVELLQDAFQDAFDAAVLYLGRQRSYRSHRGSEEALSEQACHRCLPARPLLPAPLQVGACVPEDRPRLHRKEPVPGGGADSFRLHSAAADIVEVTFSIPQRRNVRSQIVIFSDLNRLACGAATGNPSGRYFRQNVMADLKGSRPSRIARLSPRSRAHSNGARMGRPGGHRRPLRGICLLALPACPDIPREQVLRHMVNALTELSPTVRADAARALAEMQGDDCALPLRLKARAHDAEPALTGQVLESLLALERRDALPFVRQFPAAADQVSEEAALALGGSRQSGAVDVLLESWPTARGLEYRQALLRALSISRHDRAIEFLKRSLARLSFLIHRKLRPGPVSEWWAKKHRIACRKPTSGSNLATFWMAEHTGMSAVGPAHTTPAKRSFERILVAATCAIVTPVMGSYCELRIDGYDVHSCKSQIDQEVLVLFVESDKVFGQRPPDLPSECASVGDADPDFTGYVSTAREVADRLDLMGFTPQLVRNAFDSGLREQINRKRQLRVGVREAQGLSGFLTTEDEEIAFLDSLTFDRWADAVRRLVHDQIRWLRLQSGLRQIDAVEAYVLNVDDDTYRSPFGFSCADLRILIRAFLLCVPTTAAVVLDYTDLVHGEYVDRADPLASEARASISEGARAVERILVLTEGTSDSRILRASLDFLYPHLSEFVSFLDHDQFAVAGGAGNLLNLLRGFAGAGVSNRVVALFDNDTAGSVQVARANAMMLPPNFRILQLPRLPLAEKYPTLGPTGKIETDINGTAAALELYLGKPALTDSSGRLVPVQWTGYEKALARYQGELLDKRAVQERYLADLPQGEAETTDMELLLRHILHAFD
jgi:hypothetical protein